MATKELKTFTCPECGKVELEVNKVIVNSETITGLPFKVKMCFECAVGAED